MSQRLHLLLALCILLLTACDRQPPAADIRPSAPPIAPPTAGQLAPSPIAAPSAPPTARPAPTPTPAGPLTRVATWGDGIPLDAAYTPDGQSIVVLRPADLELRAAAKPAELRWKIELAALPTALAIAPDGASIAVSAGNAITIYATADGSRSGEITGLGPKIADIAISPDSRLLAAAQDDEVISLWDLAERSALRELRLPQSDEDMIVPGAFTSVAFSPNSQSVAAGDDGGNVAIWGVTDGVALQTLSINLRVVADVAFSPDGKTIAAASEGWRSEPGSIWLWDIASGAELHWLSIDNDSRFLAPAERLAFAPDGSQMLMGLADGTILRWNLADASVAQDLPGHSAAITALAYAADGTSILSASRDGSLRIWRADGTPAETVAGLGAISAIAISPDGTLVISGDEGGNINVRRPDGSLVIHIPGQGGWIYALALSPDGSTLAAANHDGVVRLWSLPSGKPSGELRGHDVGRTAIAFSPNGTRLASAGHEGSLRIWRMPGGAEERAVTVQEMDPISVSNTTLFQVAFSPDGNTIAVAGTDGISLWRSTDLTLIERSIKDAVAATFMPDGTLLTSADNGHLLAADGSSATPTPILSSTFADLTLLPDGAIAILSDTSLTIWHGPANALHHYADATAPGFSSIAAGPNIIAIGSRLGAVQVWALR